MARKFEIRKATRKGQKARIAISGASGSGKTTAALIISKVLADEPGSVLVVDTERGSSGYYSDEFDFDIVDFQSPFNPLELVDLLTNVGQDYDVIIIDSLSHFWSGPGGVLEISGGTAHGWKKATPVQNKMVDAMLGSPAHIIVCTRAKQETVIETNVSTGKIEVKRLGLKAIQREDLNYELTISAIMDRETHKMTIDKSRFEAVSDHNYQTRGEIAQFAQQFKDWLETAEAETIQAEMTAELQAQLDSAQKATDEIDSDRSPSKNEAAVDIITSDQANEIKDLFEKIKDPEALTTARQSFKKKFNVPNKVAAKDFNDAVAYALELVRTLQ